MSVDSFVLVFALVDTISMLFLSVYYIITLSDAECDYINSTMCCQKLNKVVIPEIVCNGLLLVAFLFSFNLVPFLINIPMTAWVIYRYINTPRGSTGVYDPAELHNRNGIKSFLKEAMAKLGYELLCFFFYLYWLILHLVGNDSDAPSPL